MTTLTLTVPAIGSGGRPHEPMIAQRPDGKCISAPQDPVRQLKADRLFEARLQRFLAVSLAAYLAPG